MTYADDKLFYWLSSPFVISRSPCKYLYGGTSPLGMMNEIVGKQLIFPWLRWKVKFQKTPVCCSLTTPPY